MPSPIEKIIADLNQRHRFNFGNSDVPNLTAGTPVDIADANLPVEDQHGKNTYMELSVQDSTGTIIRVVYNRVSVQDAMAAVGYGDGIVPAGIADGSESLDALVGMTYDIDLSDMEHLHVSTSGTDVTVTANPASPVFAGAGSYTVDAQPVSMLVVMRTMLDEPLAPIYYDPQTTIVPLERWSNRTVIDTLIDAEYTCTFRDIQVNHVTAGDGVTDMSDRLTFSQNGFFTSTGGRVYNPNYALVPDGYDIYEYTATIDTINEIDTIGARSEPEKPEYERFLPPEIVGISAFGPSGSAIISTVWTNEYYNGRADVSVANPYHEQQTGEEYAPFTLVIADAALSRTTSNGGQGWPAHRIVPFTAPLSQIQPGQPFKFRFAISEPWNPSVPTAGGATYNFHFRFHRRTPVTVKYELRHARLVRHQDNPANMVELTEAVQLHSDDSVRGIIYSGHDVILGSTDISLGGIGPRDEVVHDFDVEAYRHLMDPDMKHSVLFDMYTVDGEFVGPAAFDIQ